jgi:hypothetical protein
MYGDSHCGKSDLTKLMNRCFFMDWEGVSMNKTNTQKGELRYISQKSSLVTPLIEGRKDKSRFDYDGILPLYNRNPAQIRAKPTQDNAVHEIEFVGTLAFVGNKEQFTSKPAKERVVSVHFSVNDLNPDSLTAWKKLMVYSTEELAFIGHSILQNRQFFEENMISEIEYHSEQLEQKGIPVDRIAKNHAICLSGISLLMKAIGVDFDQGLFDYTADMAKTKLETAKSEFMLADHFFECIGNLTKEQGYCVIGDEEQVHLPTVLQNIEGHWDKSRLLDELKQCDKFKKVKVTRTFNGRKKCWIFRFEEDYQ